MFSNMIAKYKNYKRYTETVRELEYMSDRSLFDIGITRMDIPKTARRALRG